MLRLIVGTIIRPVSSCVDAHDTTLVSFVIEPRVHLRSEPITNSNVIRTLTKNRTVQAFLRLRAYARRTAGRVRGRNRSRRISVGPRHDPKTFRMTSLRTLGPT